MGTRRKFGLNWIGGVFVFACGMAASAQYQQQAPAPKNTNIPMLQRQIAIIQSDQRLLQEDQRLLLARISKLEEELVARNVLMKEQQEMLALYEQRFQEMERKLRESEERVRRMMAQETEQGGRDTQRAIDELRALVGKELNRVEQIAVRAEATAANHAASATPRPVASGPYREYVVQSGDSLSALATAAGVTVQALKEYNNLKNTNIRIGQKLKIPVVQQ